MGIRGSTQTKLRTRARALAISVVTAALVTACFQPSEPVPINTGGLSSGGSSGGNSGSTSATVSAALASYKAAKTTKVIFNKTSFFNNTNTNGFGCAGDARFFYDPLTDRRVPIKPDFIKNIAVEITNSNALHGASRASSCALTGLGSSPASNCASFDDLQPLEGLNARTILVGGFGCKDGTLTSCSATHALSDIWTLATTDQSTGTLWNPQPSGLATTSITDNVSPSDDSAGAIWHAGGYDELHDQFYVFGGATPNVSLTNSTLSFTNKVVRMSFNTDKTLNTAPAPEALSPSTRGFYAGWGHSSFTGTRLTQDYIQTAVTLANAGTAPFIDGPPPMVGSSFTYAMRRDPAMKSQCLEGNVNVFGGGATDACESNNLATGAVTTIHEHEDYFLLLGGMPGTNVLCANNTVAPCNLSSTNSVFQSGIFSKEIFLYKPHAISNSILTDTTLVPPTTTLNTQGDWTVVSNMAGVAGMSTSVMSIVDIATQSSSTQPYVPVTVGNVRPDGVTFTGWAGQAYHRTAYDPYLNRFYIFGGLLNTGAVSASTTAPDISSGEMWFYDPPSLGRRPTSTCFTAATPDGTALPAAPFSATSNLGDNRNFISGKFIFPPGGCLQRVKHSTIPTKRFEHAMAFDRDSRAMVVFGGCNQTTTIPNTGTTQAGDPTLNCTAPSALLDDTWVYLPPTTQEIVSKTFTTTLASPFNASTLLQNVFGTDFWLDHAPIFSGDNSPSNGALTAPTSDQTLGMWIKLTPSIKPPRRVSAAFSYDRAQHKFYLQGGLGCGNDQCTTAPTVQVLNDLWEFTPPNIDTECSRINGICTNQGTWRQIKTSTQQSLASQPTVRKGAIMAFGETIFSHGDEFYTVTDTSCVSQGPIVSGDASISKKNVGAVYIDIDRAQFASGENLLLNLRMLPFDQNSRQPAVFDNNTPLVASDDSDASSTGDQAVIRVQLLTNPLPFAEQIQASVQPRFHNFISGTPIVANEFTFIAGPTGQITERQISIPLKVFPSVNLIKIERVQGTVKFYEMTATKY